MGCVSDMGLYLDTMCEALVRMRACVCVSVDTVRVSHGGLLLYQ